MSGPSEDLTGDREGERGATLVLGAALLVVLMGMAAFSVDLGWIFLKASQAQKAAESAALAGVVHQPKPSSMPFTSTLSYTTAQDVAMRLGYSASEIKPLEVVDKPQQLEVEIHTSVPTFFMKLFGWNSVDIVRDATAEQLPPLKLGSDEPYLGTDPETPGRNRFFWVAINGENRRKEDGDPFATRCGDGGCGTTNDEFKDPAYFYAVEVPPSEAGKSLAIQVYDGSHYSGSVTGDRGGGTPTITWTTRAPSQFPGQPTAGTVVPGCTFPFTSQSSAGAPGVDSWDTVCSIASSTAGVYVLQLEVDNSQIISDFSIRALSGGSTSSSVAIYGIQRMSLDMVEAGVAPSFQVVRLDGIYAGNDLIISLFDPGDVSGGFANLSFEGTAAPFECQVRIRRESGVVIDWGSDDGTAPSGGNCFLNTSGKRFNGDWVDFRFTIPDSYNCTASCWVTVNYDFAVGATVTERTTWEARIGGQPIHLLP